MLKEDEELRKWGKGERKQYKEKGGRARMEGEEEEKIARICGAQTRNVKE